MRLPFKRLLLALLTCIAASSLHAQQPEAEALPAPPADLPLRFERFGVNQGLSQNTITSIFQDHLGFMWFGTFDGLNRFDGVSFTHFKTVPFDSTSISANAYYQEDPAFPMDDDPSIYRIVEDRSGRLWVGTRVGLDRFDRATETFTRFAHDAEDGESLCPGIVDALAVDSTGMLWAGTWGGGLCRMDPERPGRFTRYRHDPADSTSLSDDRVVELFVDRAGALWVGTVSGVDRVDPARPGAFVRFDLGADDPNENAWQRTVEDAGEDGVIWIVRVNPMTTESSLLRLDAETGALESHGLDGAIMIGVAHDPVDPAVLWVSSVGQGLHRFDTRTRRFRRVRREGEGTAQLPTDLLLDLSTDRTGSVWVGTYGMGVIRFDPTAGSFAHYDPDAPAGVHGLLEDREGRLWMGSTGKLSRLDRVTGEIRHWQPDQGDAFTSATGMIMVLHEDRRGAVWIGTWTGGVIRMDPATERFTRYPHDPADPESLTPGTVYDITEDRDGALWIGTEGGLCRMDPSTGRCLRYMHDPADPESLSPGTVWSVLEDGEGSLWVATSSGLSRMDPSTGRFTRYLHDPADPATVSPIAYGAVFEDRSGTLWVGTNGGLARMDRSTGRFRHYTERNSDLPSNKVLGILEDEAGYLWLSTSSGLSRFDPERETFRNFDHNDGLSSMEFSSGTSAFRSPHTGELFFGNLEGVTAFQPRHFAPNNHAPPVALTEFLLFNEPVAVGEGAPLRRHVSETEAVTLRHDENAVSFAFSAMHFKNAGQNQYRYRLEPYETEWVEAGTKRTATYTNLAPDRYVFRVTASNSDGVWSEQGARLEITILPPWWRTWWAYTVYGALLLGGLLAGAQQQRRRLIRRERERSHRALERAHAELEETHRHLQTTQAQLIQSEKMASLGQLTAGVAHEIRNPLNFVNNFALLTGELVGELHEAIAEHEEYLPPGATSELEEIVADLKQNAAKIAEHGGRANRIVESMLEHARSAPGSRRSVDLNAVLDENVDLAYHGLQARRGDFECRIERDYDETVGEAHLAPQEMGRVFVNLLNNAFDAVMERAAESEDDFVPRVGVSTRRLVGEVEIRIEDNGAGIPEQIRDRIFEPFFTTKPTGTGTGLGLSLSYDIVAQGHGGTLRVESEEGRGATFVVSLPVDRG